VKQSLIDIFTGNGTLIDTVLIGVPIVVLSLAVLYILVALGRVLSASPEARQSTMILALMVMHTFVGAFFTEQLYYWGLRPEWLLLLVPPPFNLPTVAFFSSLGTAALIVDRELGRAVAVGAVTLPFSGANALFFLSILRGEA
jgi:hypothetical protein